MITIITLNLFYPIMCLMSDITAQTLIGSNQAIIKFELGIYFYMLKRPVSVGKCCQQLFLNTNQ